MFAMRMRALGLTLVVLVATGLTACVVDQGVLGPGQVCGVPGALPCGPTACQGDGVPCMGVFDCCSKQCNNHVCGPPHCAVEGEQCDQTANCCANLSCVLGTGPTAARTCQSGCTALDGD